MSEHLLTDIEPRGIATVTLNRPQLHNAFDDVLIEALLNELRRLEADSAVRVVILTGAGKSFSAGADLNWMQRMAGYSYQQNLDDALGLAELLLTLDRLAKPTIALVQGAAFGGGVGLVAACDIALAAEQASFCLSEVKLGLIPAVISPYVVRALGGRASRRYMLTAERFSAAEALRCGLVHEVVPAEELAWRGRQLAETLLGNAPGALAAVKQLLRKVEAPLDEAQIQHTAERIAELRAAPEGREGVAAFLEKRRPAWVKGGTDG